MFPIRCTSGARKKSLEGRPSSQRSRPGTSASWLRRIDHRDIQMTEEKRFQMEQSADGMTLFIDALKRGEIKRSTSECMSIRSPFLSLNRYLLVNCPIRISFASPSPKTSARRTAQENKLLSTTFQYRLFVVFAPESYTYTARAGNREQEGIKALPQTGASLQENQTRKR